MTVSVYVHVPFCLARCPYCAFYSGEPLSLLEAYPALVSAEAALREGRATGPVATVYFGGGTPSLLGGRGVGAILESIHRTWSLDPGAEVTVEVNPAAGAHAGELRAAGVTRLSVGVQSLDDGLLATLGRPNRAVEALRTLEAAAGLGLDVSADLMYGLTGLAPPTLGRWIRELAVVGVTHLSAYSLEVHPGTRLEELVEAGAFRRAGPNEEDAQWRGLVRAARREGFRLYEVSNFARPGRECRHNRVYWEGGAYVGLGPGAHSFLPWEGAWGTRAWNDPGVAPYAQRVGQGLVPAGGEERLEREESLLEVLFLSLRRPDSFDPVSWCRGYGLDPRRVTHLLEGLAGRGLLRSRPGGRFAPTLAGMRRADGLALALHRGCRESTPAP